MEAPEPKAETEPLPPIGALIRQLITDARAFLEAETDLYRAHASKAARSAAWITGLVLGALILALAVMVALTVGMLFVLAPKIGMGGATLLIAGVLIAMIAVLIVLARRRIATFGRRATKSDE